MQRRTVIIYSIFVVTIIYGAYFHFFSGGGNKGKASLDSSHADVPGPATATVTDLPIQSSARQREGRNSEEKWIGDPFRNDHKYRRLSMPSSVEKTRQAQEPQLSAISISKVGAMAVVDGKVVAVGEKVGAWRLIEVTEDAAQFKGPEGSIWVRLGGSK